ncbi:MAG: 3-hydroxyacyl-CoA dehydrogenase [Bacteriovorax sp.]|jgi:NAD(P)-dependent dehydrogenase (short-subunit alcohol dehydrogenase family)
MELKNKTIIVTGGASGLGEASVRRLVGAGANVVIADLNEGNGKKIENELNKKALFITTNICDEGNAQSAIDFAISSFGNLDGLVNCAGVGTPEKIIDKEGNPHRLNSFSKIIEINLIGTFNMIRLVSNTMIKKESTLAGSRGVIINTASVAAFDGQIGQAAYSASKGAIVSMALPIARELGSHRIRVMTIAPGIFETPMLAGLPEKIKESLGHQVPFPNRLGKPDEFAALVQHIFENEMLNGEVIRLDGAMRMAAK